LLTPVLPPGLVYVQVEAGYLHTIARRSDGTAVAWGGSGQCVVPALPPGLVHVDVQAGSLDSIALRSDGAVLCWGLNSSLQLETPMLPPGFEFKTVSAGVTSVARYGPECTPPEGYCTAKVNSQGCTPAISWTGGPSFSHCTSFHILGSNVISKSFGLLIYSKTGAAASPFQGGFWCLQAPALRTTVQNSGGNGPPVDCAGQFSFEFNDYIASGADPGLTAGALAWTQYWYRGSASPSGTGLTDALHFATCP
jgi:hypothetical protein